jgi:hypothetical protein
MEKKVRSSFNPPRLICIYPNISPVSQIANIPTSGTFSYNLNAHSSNISLFGSYPAHLWFDLIYDLSVPGHQGGDNGFSFTVTSNAAATPTTWALSTSLSTTSTTSTSASTTFSTSSTASKSTTSPTVTPTLVPTIHNGLSTGAKVGIGIAAAVVAIALLVGLVWFIMSKRRIRRLEDQIAQSTVTENLKPELHGYPVVATEAHRNPPLYEMGVQNQVDGSGYQRYELH